MATGKARKQSSIAVVIDQELRELALAVRAELHTRIEHTIDMWLTSVAGLCHAKNCRPVDLYSPSFSKVEIMQLPLSQIAARHLLGDAAYEIT
jgi:hypothetical protein